MLHVFYITEAKSLIFTLLFITNDILMKPFFHVAIQPTCLVTWICHTFRKRNYAEEYQNIVI